MKDNIVKISVIIPCYNHGHFLRFALDSVLSQTFTQWEAIVVDDGSTDITAVIVEEYTDPRIRYIYQDNAGLSAARNTGIRAAAGNFFSFLDADDEWEADFLATCHQRLENEAGIAGVFTRCSYIDPEGRSLPSIGGEVIKPERFRQRLLKGGFFPPNSILIRASVLESSGLFDTNLTSVEDWDLWLRISERTSMRGIRPPLARYRVYPGSMSTNVARMHANRIAVLTKQFGSLEIDLSAWSDEKRMAYSYAYQATAIGYLRQRDDDSAWYWIKQAFEVWPPLVESVGVFYELVCRDQPRGYRGLAASIDIATNAQELFNRMEILWETATDETKARRNIAEGNAHLAVAMLFDQAGEYLQARKHLLKAVRVNRILLRDAEVRRRLVKVSLLNPKLVQVIRPNQGSANK